MPNTMIVRKPSMEACLKEFKDAIDFISTREGASISPADAAQFEENITSMLQNELPPADFFDHIGEGAFKECYSAIGNWIIKFASVGNDTKSEKAILKAAHEAGLSFLFLDTIFIDLPCPLPITHVEIDTFSGSDVWDARSLGMRYPTNKEPNKMSLVSAMFQPKAGTCSDGNWQEVASDENEYLERPLTYRTGEPVPYSLVLEQDVSSHTWLQAVIDYYGDEVFNKFCDFSTKFTITDLHEHNTGYVDSPDGERPILLDWLSCAEG